MQQGLTNLTADLQQKYQSGADFSDYFDNPLVFWCVLGICCFALIDNLVKNWRTHFARKKIDKLERDIDRARALDVAFADSMNGELKELRQAYQL